MEDEKAYDNISGVPDICAEARELKISQLQCPVWCSSWQQEKPPGPSLVQSYMSEQTVELVQLVAVQAGRTPQSQLVEGWCQGMGGAGARTWCMPVVAVVVPEDQVLQYACTTPVHGSADGGRHDRVAGGVELLLVRWRMEPRKQLCLHFQNSTITESLFYLFLFMPIWHSQQKVSVDLAERRSGPPSADGMQDKSVEGSLNRRLV